MIRSAFDSLEIPHVLVVEFMATFSRFEYVLKERGYLREKSKFAQAAWRRFATDAAEEIDLAGDQQFVSAINFLIEEPPMIQVSAKEWVERPLQGASELERAVDSVCRVRNNLFHGGKYTPHSAAGRDEMLVSSSLIVLLGCVRLFRDFREVF